MSEKKEEEKKVYKLYAMRTTNEAMEALQKASGMGNSPRFSRITANYMLIYTEDANIMAKVFPFIKYTIIGDKEVSRLSSEDRDWLTNCNFSIIAEEVEKNKDIILQNMTDAIDALAAELEKSRTAESSPEDSEDK